MAFWFPLALITTIFWGGSDLFSKMGSDPRDKYSHLKMIVAVGGVMGIVGTVMLIQNFNEFDPMSIIRYLPVSALYIGSMMIGYIGLRYLMLSISSPICNASGAVASLMCLAFLGQELVGMQFVAIALILTGTILLAVFDVKEENQARTFRGEVIEEKYKVGLLAVLIPFFYCIIDAIGIFADAVVLDGDNPIVTEVEGAIAYNLTFLVCGIVAFIYVFVIKKQKISLKEEREKGFAALCETAGQFFYIQAIARNAAASAPVISAYCVFSLIFSKLFLKEKLTKKQYMAVAVAITGIIIMGFFEK